MASSLDTDKALEVDGLCKRYPGFALEDVSFSVPRGYVTGLIFFIGACLMTTLKFILGHPAVTCVITETSNPLHAVDNFTAGVGRLPDQKTRLKMAALLQSFQATGT